MICCTDNPDNFDPYDPDFSDEGVWDLTEDDGFPVDYLDMSGDFIDIDEDCDEDCIGTGFCICSL